jgi:tRNA pseudouridine13 synthase
MGELLSSEDCRKIEETVAAMNEVLCEGLVNEGLRQERKAIRLIPVDLSWFWKESDTLQLEFSLPKGCFATSVLRELLNCQEGERFENTAE